MPEVWEVRDHNWNWIGRIPETHEDERRWWPPPRSYHLLPPPDPLTRTFGPPYDSITIGEAWAPIADSYQGVRWKTEDARRLDRMGEQIADLQRRVHDLEERQ